MTVLKKTCFSGSYKAKNLCKNRNHYIVPVVVETKGNVSSVRTSELALMNEMHYYLTSA